jgi:carbon-monoxide dehydrogenase large subunit
VRRKEDFRFLTGAGNYTDDINRPGQLYAYILRNPTRMPRSPVSRPEMPVLHRAS